MGPSTNCVDLTVENIIQRDLCFGLINDPIVVAILVSLLAIVSDIFPTQARCQRLPLSSHKNQSKAGIL